MKLFALGSILTLFAVSLAVNVMYVKGMLTTQHAEAVQTDEAKLAAIYGRL